MWVTDVFNGTLSRIDPGAGEGRGETRVGSNPRGVKTGFGYVWVANGGTTSSRGSTRRRRARPATRSPSGTTPPTSPSARGRVGLERRRRDGHRVDP